MDEMLRTDFPCNGIHIDDHKRLHQHANAQVWAADYASIQAAIDAAIQHGAGIVWLPTGVTVLDGPIDLSAGDAQALRLQGQNTILDARTLNDHAVKCTASRANLTLTDFNILAPTANYDGVHFDSSDISNSRLENIRVKSGGGYGFYFKNVFGNCWLNQLRADATRRGFYFEQFNAVSAGILAARQCAELAVEIVDSFGFDIQSLQLESIIH